MVEGPSDKNALPILVHKIAPQSTPIVALPVGKGDLFNPTKLKSHIKYAALKNPRISKIFACVDSEGIPIEETQNRVAELEKRLQAEVTISAKYIVVDHSIEGWLLCDRDAMRKVLGKNAMLPHYNNPESEPHPVNLIEAIFDRNNRTFIKTKDLPLLAQKANPKSILELSDTFRNFYQYLINS